MEEKNIELEGTKARLRMLERSLRTSSPSPTGASSPAASLARQSLKRTEKSSNLSQKLPVPSVDNPVILEADEGVKLERKGSVRFQLGEEDHHQELAKTTTAAVAPVTEIGHKDDRESSSTESSSGKVGNNFLDAKPPPTTATVAASTSPAAVQQQQHLSSVIAYRPAYPAKPALVQSHSQNFFYPPDPPLLRFVPHIPAISPYLLEVALSQRR